MADMASYTWQRICFCIHVGVVAYFIVTFNIWLRHGWQWHITYIHSLQQSDSVAILSANGSAAFELRSHWLKFLRQRHVAVVRQGPVTQKASPCHDVMMLILVHGIIWMLDCGVAPSEDECHALASQLFRAIFNPAWNTIDHPKCFLSFHGNIFLSQSKYPSA